LISFKKFLSENYKDSYMYKREEQLIFENPTFDEIKSIEVVKSWDIMRVVVVDGEIVYGFGDTILHTDVARKFELEKPLCLEINFVGEMKKFKKYSCIITLTSTNLKLGWVDVEDMKDFLYSNKYIGEKYDVVEVIPPDEDDDF